jgi:hypothetical protein
MHLVSSLAAVVQLLPNREALQVTLQHVQEHHKPIQLQQFQELQAIYGLYLRGGQVLRQQIQLRLPPEATVVRSLLQQATHAATVLSAPFLLQLQLGLLSRPLLPGTIQYVQVPHKHIQQELWPEPQVIHGRYLQDGPVHLLQTQLMQLPALPQERFLL